MCTLKYFMFLATIKSEIIFQDSPPYRYEFDVNKRCGDSSKLKKLINYSPNTDLDFGLVKTLDVSPSSTIVPSDKTMTRLHIV